MRVSGNARQFYNEFPKQMKKAEALLSELVELVRPPKGCRVKLKEWPTNELTLRNWIAIRGDMPDAEVVQLRQTDPHVDWSAVNESEDLRRVLIYLDQSNRSD
jgi:hypothetical protein